MKILVVGKGGREHALVRALAESPCQPELYCFPGSDAIFSLAQPVPVSSLHDLIAWMTQEKIDLCVAGEESYLVKEEGLANLCEIAGIPCWGPHKQSAQLEASKEFSKAFLLRHHIPTAMATVVDTREQALAAIHGQYPTVLKFDGLAAGKGVAVCPDAATAEAFLDEVLVQKRFGPGRLLVEDCLTGPEVSIFAAIVDDQYLVFTPARDYKRALDADQGPNTGGMGAVASRQLIDADLLATIQQHIIEPTVQGLRQENLPYRGFLYFGLMLTPQGPKVIEYNCRFGDPECQAVMPLVQGDLAQFCLDGARGLLRPDLLDFSPGWSVAVILASAGYPDSSRNDDPISGLDSVEKARIYHAGTKLDAHGCWTTHGGRVLAVVATADDRVTAATLAHQEAAKVQFPGSQRRSDIGIMHF
jgi:phosphoribosylamine--glycine ligase